MKHFITFLKKEPVFMAASFLAVISAFFVTPDQTYISYIDFKTLGILFSLMVVMAGYQELGYFHRFATYLLKHARNIRQLLMVLIFLCFFFSMLITNDVALITFVPLTLVVSSLLGDSFRKTWLIPTVTMQTIAANLGSMMTPIGNPQNLYLFGKAGLDVPEFLLLMAPYTGIAFLLLLFWCFLSKPSQARTLIDGNALLADSSVNKALLPEKKRRMGILYGILFILCMLSVARILPFQILCIITLIIGLITNYKVLLQVDYILLLTFIAFFVFIGNMGRLDAFYHTLEQVVTGHEIPIAIASSQVISNVPAALLLSGFTNNYEGLIIGTNLGGLGTLIASMASLISFKYINKEPDTKAGSYLLYFSIMNVMFLIALGALAYFITL